jgi:hypothetical protein
VNRRSRIWPVVALLAMLITATVWGVIRYRARPIPTAALLKRLPVRDTVILYIDFDALRQSGVLHFLDVSRTAEDPDYRRFVEKTDFDYRRDLDSALVAFSPSGKYMLVRGRFNWRSLHAYAREQGGNCINGFCRMHGSAPERQISFFQVQTGLMALAVSPDDYAARRLQESASGPNPEIPADPIWLSIPASTLHSGDLPSGTHMFATSMDKAESVVLAFSIDQGEVRARLDVRCRNEQDAADIAAQLSKATDTLRSMIAREHQKPNPSDLSGVLTAGSFHAEGRRVIGYWPINRSFLENILSGGAG